VGVTDLSAVLVTTVTTVPPLVDVFNFRVPFSNNLWALLIVSMVFNILLTWLLHIFDPDIECTDRMAMLLYIAIFASAAAQPSPPKTLPTRILQVGYYVGILIAIATYTATLTSVLFSPAAQQPSVTAIDTPAGATICALAGTVMADVVTANGGNLVAVRAGKEPGPPRLPQSLAGVLNYPLLFFPCLYACAPAALLRCPIVGVPR